MKTAMIKMLAVDRLQLMLVVLCSLWLPAGWSEITAISAGDNYTCVVVDGGVECGGENTDGQLDVPLLEEVTALSAGSTGRSAQLPVAKLIAGAESQMAY